MVKLTMFEENGTTRSGLVLEDRIYDIMKISDELKLSSVWTSSGDIAMIENIISNPKLLEVIEQIEDHVRSDSDLRKKYAARFEKAKFAPLLRPQMCHAIGMNYVHKPNRPMFVKDMLKAGSAVSAHGDRILLPQGLLLTHVSAELCAVISKKTRNVSLNDARNAVGAYTMGNDIGAISLARSALDTASTCKSFDGFGPMGPVLVSTDEIDPTNTEIKLWLNGVQKVSGNTKDAAFSIYEVIRDISSIMTLYPTDVIFLGAMGDEPFINGPGDIAECYGKGIGTLRNEFAAADWSVSEAYAKEFKKISA